MTRREAWWGRARRACYVCDPGSELRLKRETEEEGEGHKWDESNQQNTYDRPTGASSIVFLFVPHSIHALLLLSQRRLEAESEEVMEALARVGDIRDIRQRARVSYIRCVQAPVPQ